MVVCDRDKLCLYLLPSVFWKPVEAWMAVFPKLGTALVGALGVGSVCDCPYSGLDLVALYNDVDVLRPIVSVSHIKFKYVTYGSTTISPNDSNGVHTKVYVGNPCFVENPSESCCCCSYTPVFPFRHIGQCNGSNVGPPRKISTFNSRQTRPYLT